MRTNLIAHGSVSVGNRCVSTRELAASDSSSYDVKGLLNLQCQQGSSHTGRILIAGKFPKTCNNCFMPAVVPSTATYMRTDQAAKLDHLL